MATKNSKMTVDQAADEVVSAFEKFVQVLAGGNTGKVSKPAAAEEPDEDEDDDDDAEEVELTREMVEEATAEGIKSLRTLAADSGIDATKKADILAAFDELLDDEDDEEDEDDEDDDDEEEEGHDRDELEEMTLAALRKLAKSEGASAADVKGLDQDDLIDLIMGEDDDEDDEDEEEEDEEEDDDEEVEELDEDALKAMSQKDLLGLAKELEIKVPAALKKASTANKKKIVTLILDSGEEEDE